MQQDAGSHGARNGVSHNSHAPEDILADRHRVWETRKFLQIVTAASDEFEPTSPIAPESALTAYLRCLAIDLDADVAMASLLDHTTQFFLGGVSKRKTPESLRWVESPQWYGCNSISHQGGLCAPVLSQRGPELIYERLDLSRDAYTRDLPVVNGELASYRYFAGIPLITTRDKLRIGTVFIFRSRPSTERMCNGQRSSLARCAASVMAHLQLSVQALDCTRLAKFNEAVAALTHSRDTSGAGHHRPRYEPESRLPVSSDWSPRQATSGISGSETYQHAAQLLLDAFDFDGVSFQEVNLQTLNSAVEIRNSSGQHFLACETRPGARQLHPLSAKALDRLLRCFPTGAVFHRIDKPRDSSFMAAGGTSPWSEHHALKMEVGIELVKDFPDIQQLVYTPLWDSFHDRVVAIAFCWVLDWRRVYSPLSDLSPLTAFCMAVMNLVRRRESQRTEQQKADFLASISHEMRSPLHGNLANIELLLQTPLVDEQRRMLESASYSGQMLLDTIDKALAFSMHGLGNGSPGGAKEAANGGGPDTSEADEVVAPVDFARLAEEFVQEVVNKSQTFLALSPSTRSDDQKSYLKMDGAVSQDKRQLPLITLDIHSPGQWYLGHPRVFQAAISNLLSNAIQHTSEGCIRVSVSVEPPRDSASDGTVTLRVADCGIGMSHAFLQHRIFVPFMQEDQLKPGTGLGLALVKRAVESVRGLIRVESDVAEGTTITVALPIKSHTSTSPSNLRNSSPFSSADALQVHLCMPTATIGATRQARSLQLLYDSISSTLRDGTDLQLSQWHPGARSDLILVCEDDLPWLDKMMADANETPQIVLYSRAKNSGNGVSVKPSVQLSSDCILPSHLVRSIRELLRNLRTIRPSDFVPETLPSEIQATTDSGLDISSLHLETGEQGPLQPDSSNTNHQATARTDTPAVVRKPTVLLVDDNLINLKVLTMYIQKCAVASSTSVSGGQEAIDAFQEEWARTANSFDIVFMDLSMPHVSGFEATAAIRRWEASKTAHGDLRRARIVALTGLVSAKDRVAAFDAGVDDYVTKPAKVADVRRVVDLWVHENACHAQFAGSG